MKSNGSIMLFVSYSAKKIVFNERCESFDFNLGHPILALSLLTLGFVPGPSPRPGLIITEMQTRVLACPPDEFVQLWIYISKENFAFVVRNCPLTHIVLMYSLSFHSPRINMIQYNIHTLNNNLRECFLNHIQCPSIHPDDDNPYILSKIIIGGRHTPEAPTHATTVIWVLPLEVNMLVFLLSHWLMYTWLLYIKYWPRFITEP